MSSGQHLQSVTPSQLPPAWRREWCTSVPARSRHPLPLGFALASVAAAAVVAAVLAGTVAELAGGTVATASPTRGRGAGQPSRQTQSRCRWEGSRRQQWWRPRDPKLQAAAPRPPVSLSLSMPPPPPLPPLGRKPSSGCIGSCLRLVAPLRHSLAALTTTTRRHRRRGRHCHRRRHRRRPPPRS